MSTVGAMELMPPPSVSYTAYLGAIWALVALSGITLACRLVSRFQGPHRLFLDDGLVVFPWLLSLVTAAVWQWAARDMYYIMNVQAGLAIFAPDKYLPSLRNWLNASLIAELFFYTALFSIKLSFLFFFRRLGNKIKHFRYIWWGVLFVTVSCYLASVGNVDYKCLVGTIEQITVVCQTKHEINFTTATLKANAALDIVTDFMSLSTPYPLPQDPATHAAPMKNILLTTYHLFSHASPYDPRVEYADEMVKEIGTHRSLLSVYHHNHHCNR